MLTVSRTTPAPVFSKTWARFFDEAVPAFIKDRFSPRQAWRSRPFGEKDLEHHLPAIAELSNKFTQPRSGPPRAARKVGGYLSQPRLFIGYLLYFLPLQAAKLTAILQTHPRVLEPLLARDPAGPPISILDLGAGPATASLAVLLELDRRAALAGRALPRVELVLVDRSSEALEAGAWLLDALIRLVPGFAGRVSVDLVARPLEDAAAGPRHLVLLAGVLNELSMRSEPRTLALMEGLVRASEPDGAGIVILEPAEHHAAQSLAGLRDALVDRAGARLAGPCLHNGPCPLSSGKDWCHFSAPAKLPLKWFDRISRALAGASKQWLKYSYLWLAAPGARLAAPHAQDRLVVSEPIKTPGAPLVLVCEPERVGRVEVPRSIRELHRGDLVRVAPDGVRPGE